MSLGIRTPGPIHLFARFRNNSTGFYLGTCVAAPEPELEKFKIPVMNDLGGRSVPFQLIQDGESGYCVMTMNRFDYALVQSIRGLESRNAKSSINAGNLSGDLEAGSEFSGARGTLVLGLNDWQLIQVNEYANTTAAGSFNGTSDLIPARIFASANLRKYKESTVGTRVLEVSMVVEFQNIYNPAGLSFQGGSAATLKGLYSEDPSKIGTLASFAA